MKFQNLNIFRSKTQSRSKTEANQGSALVKLGLCITFRNSGYWATGITLFGLLLLNLIGVLLSAHYGGFRPLINIDYVLPILAIVWSRSWVASVAFTFLAFEDFVLTFLPTFSLRVDYFWVSMVFLDGVRFLSHGLILIALVCCIGLVVGFRWIISRLCLGVHERGFTSLALVVAVGLVLLLDALNGTSALRKSDQAMFPYNIASSPTLRIAKVVLESAGKPATFSRLNNDEAATYRIFRSEEKDSDFDSVSSRPGDSGSSADLAELASSSGSLFTDDNCVLILVESLGCLTDDPGRTNLFRPLLDLTNRYAFKTGSIQSYGATVAAELRELCWSRRSSGKIDEPPTFSIVRDFAKQGFETVSFHGFYKSMFSREGWYPKLGFKRSVFIEDYDREIRLGIL